MHPFTSKPQKNPRGMFGTDVQAEISHQEKDIRKEEINVKQYKMDLGQRNQKLSALKQKAKKFEMQKRAATRKVHELQTMLQEMDDDDGDVATQATQMETDNVQGTIREMQQDIKECERNRRQMETEKEDLTPELEEKQRRFDEIERQGSNVTDDAMHRKDRLKRLADEYQGSKRREESLQKKIEKYTNAKKECEERVKEFKEQLEEIEGKAKLYMRSKTMAKDDEDLLRAMFGEGAAAATATDQAVGDANPTMVGALLKVEGMEQFLADKCSKGVVDKLKQFASSAGRSNHAEEDEGNDDDDDGDDDGSSSGGRKRKRSDKGKGKKKARVAVGQLDHRVVSKVTEVIQWLAEPARRRDDNSKDLLALFQRCRGITSHAERVTTDQTQEQTQKDLRKKQAQHQRESTRQGEDDPEQLRRDFKHAKNEYEKLLRKQKNFSRNTVLLEKSRDERKLKYLTMRTSIKKTLKHHFNDELEKRNSTGKLSIDFKTQEMGIEVNTNADEDTQDTQMPDMALSKAAKKVGLRL